MQIRNRRELKQAAAASLSSAPGNYKRLISIHIGLTLAVTFAISIFSFVLDEMIGSTGGLGGVGTRAMLETAQSSLLMIQTVAAPFWQFGWLCTIMAVSRQETTSFDTLLTGFRRFGPYLRLMLLQLAMLSLGCGVIISAATTKYRDLRMLVSFGVQLWMYASPVAYDMFSMGVFAPGSKYYGAYMLNPVTPIVNLFRYAYLGIGQVDWLYYGISWIVTLVLLFVGVVLFSRVEKTFMDTV